MTSLTAMITSWLGMLRPTDTEKEADADQEPEPQRPFVPTKPLCETDLILLDMLNSAGRHEQEICYCISDPDAPDCPIIFASDGFCGYTGYSATEIEGQNCRFLQGPDTKAKDITRIRQAVQRYTHTNTNNTDASSESGTSSSVSASQEALSHCDPVSVNLLNYRKDGTSFCNEFFLAPLRDSNKKLQYLIGVQCPVKNLGPGQAPSNAGYVTKRVSTYYSRFDSIKALVNMTGLSIARRNKPTRSHTIFSTFYFLKCCSVP
jgi:hypothetical protein